jgi:DNA-binding response OmpR family regulator
MIRAYMSKDIDVHSIAIIEYEKDLTGFFTQFFTIRGFNVSFIASNETDALSSFLASDPRPRVVVLDHRKGVMDGIKIMKEVHEAEPDVKIIFLSTDRYDEEAALNSGAAIFHKKPVNLTDIDNAVKKLGCVLVPVV